MRAQLLRRFVGLAVTLLAASAAIFLVMNVLPGDPAAVMLGTSARPDTLAALRLEMGLDRPVVLRYGLWLAGALTGHLGASTTYGVPVAGLMVERLSVTLPLALLAVLLSVGIAVPLGVGAAARRGGIVDAIATIVSQACVAVPNFWGRPPADPRLRGPVSAGCPPMAFRAGRPGSRPPSGPCCCRPWPWRCRRPGS